MRLCYKEPVVLSFIFCSLKSCLNNFQKRNYENKDIHACVRLMGKKATKSLENVVKYTPFIRTEVQAHYCDWLIT